MSFSISEKCFTPLLLINYVHIWEALFYPQQVKNTIPKKILRFFITYKLYKKVRFTLHQWNIFPKEKSYKYFFIIH